LRGRDSVGNTAAAAISAVDQSGDFIGIDDDIDAVIDLSHKFGKPLHWISHHWKEPLVKLFFHY